MEPSLGKASGLGRFEADGLLGEEMTGGCGPFEAVMSAHDYLLDHDGFHWPELLSGWAWLLPEEVTVWLVNRFGDVFLTLPDRTVHMLDVGAGSLTRLADDREDFFRKLDEEGNAEDWLMTPLVDRLVASSVRLQPGQCYSFVVPPVLGGDYTAENTVVLPVEEHYGLYGSYHDQLRGLPDGERVVIKVVDPPSP